MFLQALHGRQKPSLPGRQISVCILSICEDMKKITLENIKGALENDEFEVLVDEETGSRARKAIEAMLKVK